MPDPAAGRGRIGLALGGGAARGWAHIGILRALTDAGIEPDIVAGSSIGAVVGGCWMAGQLQELERFAVGLTRRRIIGLLDFNLAGTGLITGGKLGMLLDQHIGATRIEALPKPFAAVATEVATGHEVWLRRGSLVEAMRASYALPGIFPPVKINQRWLFDGALVNPIPVSVCRALGARYVIAVNLNTDVGRRGTIVADVEDFTVPLPAEPVDPDQKETKAAGTMRTLLRRQWFGNEKGPRPGISSVVVDALSIVQDRIARSRLAGDPPDAMLTPRLAGVGPFDFHRAEELIEHGRAAVWRQVDELRQQLDLNTPVAEPPDQPATI